MYRGTFAIIDEAAIEANVKAIHGRLSTGTKMLVAVKANGYGHGMIQAARAALAGGADYLGVATLEEALALRGSEPDTPILVLGTVSPVDAQLAAVHHIDITVSENWPELPQIPRFASKLRIHLKVDTGMTRLGFRSTESLLKAAGSFTQRSDVEIVGVFTHLACADAVNLEHAERQVAKFAKRLRSLRETGLSVIAHAANSAAILRVPEWHFDMVRLGISAYGLPPSDDFPMPVKLRQAMHLYSFVSRVAEINRGETVGYGATYQASRKTRIATVSVGYGDGYPRHLSNRGYVLIKGKRAPVAGNVCMDQLMIDVTEVPGVSVGDCVTLYGDAAPSEWNIKQIEGHPEKEQAEYLVKSFRQHQAAEGESISIHHLAKLAGTISYELLCALSQRVVHLYTGRS